MGFNSGFKRLRYEWLGAFSKIAESDYKLRHVLPPVRTEQLGSHRTDFNEISYLSIFRKSVKKFQGALESDENNGDFT